MKIFNPPPFRTEADSLPLEEQTFLEQISRPISPIALGDAQERENRYHVENGHITELRLYISDETEIPDAINDLQSLKHLDIIGINIPYTEAVPIHLHSLESIRIVGFVMDSFPRWILQNPLLKKLHLDIHCGEDIPSDLGDAQHLEILSLAGHFRLLPASRFHLQCLKCLEIGHTVNIEIVPEWIQALQTLEKLCIKESDIRNFPPEIGQLPNLREIEIDHVQGINLESWSGRPGLALKKLTLRNIGLQNVPPWIRNLRNLEYLSLEGNNISALPEWFYDLRSLKELFFDNNQICFLSDSMRALQKLEILSVSHNALRVIGYWVNGLGSLRILRLNSNSIAEFPNYLFYSDALEEVDLTNNMFSQFPMGLCDLRNLLRLFLGENQIASFSTELIDLPQLEILDLRSNLIELIDLRQCHFPQLKTLRLNLNRLKRLPPEIGHLTKLERLDLRENQLEKLPYSLCWLTKLCELRIRGNNITSLPTNFGFLTKLQCLDMMQNNCFELPSIANLSQITELSCDAELFGYFYRTFRDTLPLKMLQIGNYSFSSWELEAFFEKLAQWTPSKVIENLCHNRLNPADFLHPDYLANFALIEAKILELKQQGVLNPAISNFLQSSPRFTLAEGKFILL